MDADIVREIEFSRSLRGYNTAEVDAFLERMEGMFRRRDLEQENLEKKLQEQSQRGTEQENRISFLAAKVEEGQQEAETLRAELANVQAALEAEKVSIIPRAPWATASWAPINARTTDSSILPISTASMI